MRRASIRTLEVTHDTKGARTVRGANAPDAGLLVAAVPPDIQRSYELTWELLAGLGKLDDVRGSGRHENINWEVLIAWVLAHEITHVVIVDAQWLNPLILNELIGFALVTEVELWLLAQLPVSDVYAKALSSWPAIDGRAQDLADILKTSSPTPPPSESAPFPRVPDDSYLSFRATARKLLDPAAFEQVDALYRSSFQAVCDWLSEIGDTELGELVVLEVFRRLLSRCGTVDEMVAAVRAAQAACHRHGWLVSVDLTRLILTAESVEAAAIDSPDTWARLRAYREPFRGAACAVASADVALDVLGAVRVGDVALDGTSVALQLPTGSKTFAVPPGADLFLRAQLWHRTIQGAASEELLFANDDGPQRSRALADAIRDPIADVGVSLFSQRIVRAEFDDRRWSRRYGLSVRRL